MNYFRGLHLVTQEGAKAFTHFGVLDIGNNLWLSLPVEMQPIVVVHLTPPQLRYDYFNPADRWQIIKSLPFEQFAEARERFERARMNPIYHELRNNCEQFARFVIEGESYSVQLQKVAFGALAVAVGFGVTR
jgi:hypothetical protein